MRSRASQFICSRCFSSRVYESWSSSSTSSSFTRRNHRIRFQSTSTNRSTGPTTQTSLRPSLLRRAESLATEHATLSAQNAESYDTEVAKRIGELAGVSELFKKYRETQEANLELEAVLSPTYQYKELQADAKAELEHNNVTLLPQLARRLETSLIPKHPFAALPTLIELHSGAGGSEASLFAAQLLRMYQALCSQLGLSAQVLKKEVDDSVHGEAIVDAILEVSTPGTYDLFRTEAGVHRVQRVPATEKKGRTHTSAVSVIVLPSFPSNDQEGGGGIDTSAGDPNDPTSPNYIIPPSDVKSETMRARGAGGQHVNKTSSAIRLTHIPSGIIVSMQDSRSQHANRAEAWRLLRAKLAQRERERREGEMAALRRSVGGGKSDRSDKVRTYNFDQRRVTDHRSGGETRDLDGVLEGGPALEDLMLGVKDWLGEREVEVLILEEDAKEKDGEKSKTE
ncbi:putative peptide chain release factor 1 [Phaeomoniella chlamydospora]|uniref:Putative peptide chain release factor 1 n=1 Tax=Phaeomoniella chlamydospora TaxID=158046 RepID=A0A0G2EQQ4_PHACM|nr:putative peptide chain release factor 1 [Phaeomoniella chlamydospora]